MAAQRFYRARDLVGTRETRKWGDRGILGFSPALHRKVLSGQFPAPIRLSEGVVAYPAEAVERWIEEQSSDAIQALIPKSAFNLDGCGAAGGPANDRAHIRKSRGWGPRDPDNPARRLFLPAKNNVAQDVGGLAFSVEPFTLPSGIETSRILWERDPVSMTADEAMQPPPENGERTMTEDAVELLRAILTNGLLLARDIKRQATDAGISDKTLRTARQRLNVTVDREGFGANTKTFWSLRPGSLVPSNPIHAHETSRAQVDDEGTSGQGGATCDVGVEDF